MIPYWPWFLYTLFTTSSPAITGAAPPGGGTEGQAIGLLLILTKAS